MPNNKESSDLYSDISQMNARTVSKWYDRVVDGVEKCPFCDLKEKYIVKELESAVLTMNLFPYIEGHLMVIPKRHVEYLNELSTSETLEIKALIDSGIEVLKNEMGYININVLYREGDKDSGSSLKHLHIHVLPITSDFLQYEKTNFKWVFQKISIPPRELALKLRNYWSKKE